MEALNPQLKIYGEVTYPNGFGGISYRRYEMAPTGKWFLDIRNGDIDMWIEMAYKKWFGLKSVTELIHESKITLEYTYGN